MEPLLPPKLHDRLVEAIWKLDDPQGYAASKMNALQMRNPTFIRSDSKPYRAQQQFYDRYPGYALPFVQRGQDTLKQIEQGPLTGTDLDKIIMDVLREGANLNIQNKEKPGA